MKILSVLTLIALSILPSRLYSVNSEIDSLKRKAFRSKKESIQLMSSINKNYILRVKKSTGKIKLDGIIDEGRLA